MNKEARISWIDIAKYICIMCVILIHMESCTELLRSFFRPFYLSLFFFLSGYVHKQSEYKIFVQKKIKQLLVPWFIFSMLNVFLTYLINGRSTEYAEKHGSIIEVIGWNFLQIRGFDDGMWFVAALFVTYFPFYFIIQKYLKEKEKDEDKKRINLIVVVFCLSLINVLYTEFMPAEILPWNSSALPWHMEYIFKAIFFMTLGYLFREYYEVLWDKKNNVLNRIVLTVIYLLVAYIPMIWDVNSMVLSSIFYYYISSLLGIIVIISWCKVAKSNSYILFIGRNTLIIFGIHNYVFRIIEKILASKFTAFYGMILDNVVFSTVFALFFAIVVSIILIIPTYIIEKYFPWTIGRKKIQS